MTQDASSKAVWIDSALSLYEAPLLRYAARLLGDTDRARDAVQETFLRLCREEPARLDGHLVPWLFTVCRSRALDLRRKDGRLEPFEAGVAEQQPAPGPSPARALEDRQALASVREVLDTLPLSQQEALRLKFQEGLSYKEIGAVTGKSVSHVGVLIHEGLKRVRARLGQKPALQAVRRVQ